MNIKRAKEEIKNTIRAYLERDAYGNYLIPAIRQRPILLMGPPGIGKTQIMEQVARECRVGLVSYTITHHTRQSAIGLPFIEKKQYGGREYSVTEYTMSEIIASVYDKMEETGLKEGILFIDEINCVSETLAPTMLQFLQCKTFGNQKVPEGWVIVAAGNPPEYNKSVREFDIVTLDRVKKIDVEDDFGVWKEYAYRQGIHGAVISYLDIRRENFYQIQTTVDGAIFATARGWEDLSQMIYAYEKLGIPVDQDVVYQYIQHKKIAKDFANYLDLYYKYQDDYQVDEILQGKFTQLAAEKLRIAPFDEKLSVISLLLSKLSREFQEVCALDWYVTDLHAKLAGIKEQLFLAHAGTPEQVLAEEAVRSAAELEQQKNAGQVDRLEEQCMRSVIRTLEEYRAAVQTEHLAGAEQAFALVKERFQKEVERRKAMIAEAAQMLDYAFDFMEAVFGESQEMVVFITELTVNYYSVKFINENGCDRYYQYNKGLLFNERQKQILGQIDDLRDDLRNTLG